METLRSSPEIPQSHESTPRKHGIVDKADRYFRRSDTPLAKLAYKICPYKGKEYLDGKCKVKRVLDIGVSIPAAVIAAPVISLLGIAKKLEDGGPAFFIQPRLGQHEGEKVNIVKIRSMKERSDNGIENIHIARGLKPSEDPRNTKFGAFMRNYQLEELPQLFQVVQGKFSMVGVRPEPQYGLDYIQEVWSEERCKRWTEAYHSGPLGLTGVNQIFGSKLKEDEKRFHPDVFFVKNDSLGLDLYLIWKTIVRFFGDKS
jgi:lipopolysaccharide/colanic/teichoic acid biosynthesis glycosyltransferase